MPKNFAITGVAGFVAPRHLRAIKDTGNRLIAAVDPHDSVGRLDGCGFDVQYFSEIERFDRLLEKLRRRPEEERVHYVTICSPNYLHDAHIRLALRVGADVVCEKPLVINPWNLDALEELERETGRRVSTVLQLRLHPVIVALREKLREQPAARGRHEVVLTYVTARGRWYDVSWKGSEERSGGLATNIGIHLFDLLYWLFGDLERCQVHLAEPRRMAGALELQRANVRWFLSVESGDLPPSVDRPASSTFRQVTIDGEDVDFNEGFTDLHTRVYEQVLAGRGFGIQDARPSIEMIHRVRHTSRTRSLDWLHPVLQRGR